jgi:hypothetical protein
MTKITFPLKLHMQGPAVADLQDALQLCLDRGALLANDNGARTDLSTALKRERVAQMYGDATAKLVTSFQQERRLVGSAAAPSGEVDEPTANALNALLKQWGLLDQMTEPISTQSSVVSGQVRRDDGLPLPGLRVRATHETATSSSASSVLRLGEDTTDAEGHYTIRYESLPQVDGINLRVTVFSTDGVSLHDSGLIRGAKPVEIVDLVVPSTDIRPYRVEGTVASSVNPALGGLRVAIVDKGVGGDTQLAQATTDNRGAYEAFFSDSGLRARGKAQPDLQARVFGGDVFFGASDIHYNASQHEILNVLLEAKAASALPSEHEVLTSALTGAFKGKLSDLKETDQQQDITYLANKTGWDARAVALAALADQFGARTLDTAGTRAIPHAFFYALFRAGLAASEDTLYHTDPKTLETVWKQAADQGVIPKTAIDQIPNVIGRFQALSAQKLLTRPALIGASSLKEMLAISRLNDAQQAKFAQLYAANRTNMPAFWKAIGDAFGKDVANRLQVDGKLGFLTINNAPLSQKAHTQAGANGLSDPLQLAQMGYHRPEAWSQLLTPDLPIPKEIQGNTPDTRRANYASYLAAQVRLSYPTAAVAQMVKTGELPLTGAPAGVSDQVHAFLTQHQGKFEIGVQPVSQYIAQNKLQVAEETVKQVKRLQRVYQITSSDQAMIGLMKRGIDAAYHVVRYGRDTFVKSFESDLGGADHAALTYDRSVQIHNTVLNIALGYLNARTAPAIGVHSPPKVVDPAPSNPGDIIAYASMESLFGSMDFCACAHCRSILSPAAYLVDLLLFLSSDPDVWADFLKTWKQDHANAPYPFVDQNAWQTFQNDWNSQHPGQPLPVTEISPFDVLSSRRPDIQHLPLTCENTNTALPYVDIVNETLEYYVANGLSLEKRVLDEYVGHDTNGVASEDLLASPQFVMDSAYATLRNERFPILLPFHQLLENLRRYFNKFEVPLQLAMERFRKTDDLEHGANPYGWRDILMEGLALSRAEYEILTDSPSVVSLWQMFGFPSGTADGDVVAGLSNVKQFSRRVGITYVDLISILRTRFVNPNSDLMPKLERLGVSFTTLKALKDGTITDAAFDALLPSGLTSPDPAEYGGDIKAWIRNQANYSRIMGQITLAISTGPWSASKAYAIGDFVRPTKASSESTLYCACTTPGTSAAAEPMWPVTPGLTSGDGSVTWTCRDASSCASFDDLVFCYSDPGKLTQNIGAVEFVRLIRFIRVWRKLGRSIDQTDAALCAFYRADLQPIAATDVDTVAKLDAGFLTLLPRLGIMMRVINALNLTTNRDLLSLLACFAPIGVHDGVAWSRDSEGGLQQTTVPSLYRQIFLNPTLLKQDPVFDDNGYGEFLSDSTIKLSDHAEALRAAFNLSGEEYDSIVAALGYTNTPTPLTIPNISAIFHRGWLARKLKLSVRELLLLTRLAGLDPFVPPDPAGPAILHLISIVQALKDRSLKSAVALYLIWNQDLSGKSAPELAQVATFARTLRLGLAAAETEFAIVDDPDGAITQNRMTMVYGTDAAAFFFGLLNDTFTVEIEFSDSDGVLAPGALRQAIQNAAGKTAAGASRIAYDDFRKCLSYYGRLTIATRDAIKSAAGPGAAEFKTVVDNLFEKNQAIIGPFFGRYPELQSPYDAYVTDTAHSAPEKRSILLKAILPELIQRRKRQQALQLVSAVANTDSVLTQTFLDPAATPYPLHAVDHSDQPALNDLLALETPGLSVQFFASDTAAGAVIPNPDIASSVDYSPAAGGTGNPLPANPTPGAAISGLWRGCLEAPETGFFNLRIDADAGAMVTLQLDGRPVALIQNGTLWNNTDPLELRAGTLYSIKLTAEKVRNVVRVQWDWEPKGQGRAVIPSRYLYPASLFDRFQETYVRFLKVASLATGLGLTANELAFFATHSDYRIDADGWLNVLTTSGDPSPVAAAALLKPFEALLDFARIKTEVSPADESLLTVLQDPVTATQNADSLLFTITRWDQASLNDTLSQFGSNIAGLGHFDLFRRVYDAFAIIRKMGIPAKALIQVTTNEPLSDTVQNLQSALRARYEATDWRDLVRPINDEMRSLQRDALLTYILHQMQSHPESAHIDTPDKLFEYFLMDVQMDPSIQTSRIRHALSSVQLFIGRCLMNLEPRVSPAAINGKQWEWMKRYRVWEANRKVYLFPENWLESELRDDKSPFFKEIESELLQGDITEDSAATALLNYLAKLEEVAKLEPCGIHYVPADQATRKGEVAHVVARTVGAHRKYYYRRYEYGYWTPWEQIKSDIEDNPVIPVVWNDRLFVFWLRIVKHSPLNPDAMSAAPGPIDNNQEKSLSSLTLSDMKGSAKQDAKTNTLVTVQAVLCWNEYYNGKWQPTRTSDVGRPLKLGEFGLDESKPNGFDRSKLKLAVVFWTKGAMRLIISGTSSGVSFFLHNPHSLPEPRENKKESHFSPRRTLETTTNTLKVDYSDPDVTNFVLGNPIGANAVQPNHPVDGNSWDPPFFYEDARNVFYVTTSEQLVWVPQWKDFGIFVTPPEVTFHIPPLVLQPAKIVPDPIGPIIRQPGFGRIDSAPVERYVTEDAYIHQAIGTFGTVRYGDTEIGLAGSQVKSIRMR